MWKLSPIIMVQERKIGAPNQMKGKHDHIGEDTHIYTPIFHEKNMIMAGMWKTGLVRWLFFVCVKKIY